MRARSSFSSHFANRYSFFHLITSIINRGVRIDYMDIQYTFFSAYLFMGILFDFVSVLIPSKWMALLAKRPALFVGYFMSGTHYADLMSLMSPFASKRDKG